jgi:hypothetical protein
MFPSKAGRMMPLKHQSSADTSSSTRVAVPADSIGKTWLDARKAASFMGLVLDSFSNPGYHQR